MIKKLLLAGIMTAMVLSGCSSSDDKKEENTNTTQNEENTSSDPDAEYEALKENPEKIALIGIIPISGNAANLFQG